MGKPPPPQPAPPLPQSCVVSLQRWNDRAPISNANWSNKLNEQINVNNGDSIFVKSAYLDTRGTASANIDLLVDTEISLTYYFYWVHTFNACDASGITTSSADISSNLTQQVLVGQSIPYLYNAINADASANVPGYLTVGDPSHNFSATGINDADGLPYIVYQSSPKFPVPGTYGPIIPASQIVPGTSYVVHSNGFTTNWEYAGVPFAAKNSIPNAFILDVDSFVAAANPNGVDVPALVPLDTNPGMSPSEFLLPANVTPNLPYVSYMVTVVGDTDWLVIDPGGLGSPFDDFLMVLGRLYTIETLGTINFIAYGAASNTIDLPFTYALTPPTLAPVDMTTVPMVLDTAFFLSVAGDYVPNDASGGLAFGFSPDDLFNCTVGVNGSGDYTVSAITGSGGWAQVAGGVWTIPVASFPQPYTNMCDGDLVLTITSVLPGQGAVVAVTDLVADTEYTIGVIGDGNDTTFTWNLVTNSFPTALSSDTFTTGEFLYNVGSYNAINNLCCDITFMGAPDTNNASYWPVGALTSIPFSNPILLTAAPAASPVPPLTDTNSGIYLGGSYQFNLFNDLSEFNISISPDANGICQLSEGSVIEASAPVFQNEGATPWRLVINKDVLYTFGGDLVWSVNDPEPTTNLAPATPSLTSSPTNYFPYQYEFLTGIYVGAPFVATGPWVPGGSNPTLASAIRSTGTITGATVSSPTSPNYVVGTVVNGEVIVGDIIQSLFADPAPPSTGRAVIYPTPNEYDGTVKEILIPPSFITDIRPVKKTWKMMLKAGSYDPNYLAELISRNMSKQKVKRVNQVTGGPFGTQSTLTVPTDSIYNTQTADWANPGGSGQNTFYDSKNPKVYGFPSQTYYNINPDNDDMPFLFVPSMNSSTLHANQPQTPPDYIFAEIPHPNANGLNNLPNPTYYINLVPLIGDVRSVSPTIPTNISGGYYSILPFYSQNTVAAGAVVGHGGIFPIAFGATQTSLLYNNENNGLFSFNYMHSPILAFLSTTTSDLTECTAHMFVTQKVSTNMKGTNFFTTLIDKKSGVLLNEMNPPSFWNQLGFNIEALTVDLDNKPPGFQMTLDEFEARTTGGFCGSSNIFNQTFHTKGSADQPSVPDTELLFLTGTVGPAAATTIIPFTNQTPDMVVGVTYTIATLGLWYTGDEGGSALDWSYVATALNEGDDITNCYIGMEIVATNNWDGKNYYYISGGDVILQGYWYVPPAEPNGQNPSVLLGAGSGSTTTQLQNNYFSVTNTISLNAAAVATQRDNTGHYLLEITGYSSVYLDDFSKYEIKSIVSSYYIGSAGSFVSQPFPDSYNYYHYGSPISLSNIKCRILNPYTMEEAVVGPNSSVYLQINKLLTDQAVQQVEN